MAWELAHDSVVKGRNQSLRLIEDETEEGINCKPHKIPRPARKVKQIGEIPNPFREEEKGILLSQEMICVSIDENDERDEIVQLLRNDKQSSILNYTQQKDFTVSNPDRPQRASQSIIFPKDIFNFEIKEEFHFMEDTNDYSLP